ncbi:unnamed protein product [Schistocephalus solidus]|uniref:PriCT_2 domain-containing protein n=1 Tax=Schistocephalus solidus TaxID=70667 RepID=A0A183SWI3_SCHSO|nr:unnamed protein product [Schistocephalus solidus]
MTAAISPVRPSAPNPFQPGDDYFLGAFRAQNFLPGVPPKAADSYLVSHLNDLAVRQLVAMGISLDANALFDTLNDIFDRKQPAALALEAFGSRRQLTKESTDGYVGSLRELALKAFPDESPVRSDTGVNKHFTLGVRNTELYWMFVRKEYVYLKKALDVARGYEAPEVAQRRLASAHLRSVSQPIPSNRRPSPHAVYRRQVPPISCPIVSDLASGPRIKAKIPNLPSAESRRHPIPMSGASRLTINTVITSEDAQQWATHQVADPDFGEIYNWLLYGSMEPTGREMKDKSTAARALCAKWASWDEHLSHCLLAYWTAVHDSTGFCPALLKLGRELRFPADIYLPLIPAEEISMGEYARALKKRLVVANRITANNFHTARKHQKICYDLHTAKPQYSFGDPVLLSKTMNIHGGGY